MGILVTGGAGYTGSRVCVELLNLGYKIVVIDNLCNSSEEPLNRVEKITGGKPVFYRVDLLDKEGLEAVFVKETAGTVIHFTGSKAVGGSVAKPLEYYRNNIAGTLVLCNVMKNHGVKRIVFSSSATVYGDPAFMPTTKDCPKGKITNPCGRTKGILEWILTDLHTTDPEWGVILLRCLNPVGAHKNGLIGRDSAGISNNLTPYTTRVAVGKLREVGVFGDDCDTPDGTGVRGYIHVADLAIGHVKVLGELMEDSAVHIYDLRADHGYSVLNMVKTFSKACGKETPYVIKPRKPGGIATCYTDPALAKKELG